MAAIFVQPFDFSIIGGSTPVAPTVALNMNSDVMTLVWRGDLSGYVILNLGASTPQYDTVAILGSNLRNVDTVRIQTGPSTTGTGGYDTTLDPSWTGTKPAGNTSTIVHRLPTPRQQRYMRIDFSAGAISGGRVANPDGYVEVSRIVVGKAVTTGGLAYGAKYGMTDGSIINEGPNYRTADRYTPLPAWSFSTDGITDASARTEWYPLLQYAGQSNPILFVVDDTQPANYQTDVVFGPITNKAQIEFRAVNFGAIDLTIQALSV